MPRQALGQSENMLYLSLFAKTWMQREFCLILRNKLWNILVRGNLLPRLGGAFDLRLAVSVPLPIVMGIFVLLWFQSRLT